MQELAQQKICFKKKTKHHKLSWSLKYLLVKFALGDFDILLENEGLW